MIEVHDIGLVTWSSMTGNPLPDNIAASFIEELNRRYKNSYYRGVRVFKCKEE